MALALAGAAIVSALAVLDDRVDAVAHADTTAAQTATPAKLHLDGVHEQGNILGRPSAPATLAVFSDLQCPVCTPFFLESLPRLLTRWVLSGMLRVDYLPLETATHNRHEFFNEEIAALAAGAQDKEWLYVERFYQHQGEEGTGYASEHFLDQLAAETPGLSIPAWEESRTNSIYASEIAGDERLANRHHATGTPEYLLGRTGGTLHTLQINHLGKTSVREFNTAIARLLSRPRPR